MSKDGAAAEASGEDAPYDLVARLRERAGDDRHRGPEKMLAFVCGLSSRLEPYLVTMARCDIITLRDLETYTEEAFFGRIQFSEPQRSEFLGLIRAAGGKFKPPRPPGAHGEEKRPSRMKPR